MNVSVNVSRFDAFFVSDASSDVHFSVFNGSDIISSGVIFPGVFEHVGDVLNGSVLTFSAWSDRYYFGNVSVNVSVDNSSFNLSLRQSLPL